ncbi:hypothetical protein M413DRAFT_446478 [Hebeloma cylindrosporum]|uniref:Uncharacterized protein n=1 Tax=Hebeloma cylindrosporum TaxID=76867 RepID=A0A0C3BUE7_HEBCY|nr:hypothetical protein M413DRAFT_446478 [Hebeloma cylindrosporum h7]
MRTISDIPDKVLDRILVYRSRLPDFPDVRLINKRLSMLALPHTLRTVSVRSPESLLRIISAPLSPFYAKGLGVHVRCFELGITPRDYEILESDDVLSISLPNLDTLRFRFTLGVSIESGEQVQTLLSEDTLGRATQCKSNGSWLRFLSQFHPQKFEWISNDTSNMHLVGLYRDFRSVFLSLTSIFLDGICLVEQSTLTSWCLSVPAERVHIKGPFSKSKMLLLDGLRNFRGSTTCRALTLESFPPDSGSSHETSSAVPLLTFGNTTVSTLGWNSENRQRFLASLTGNTPPPPARRYEENAIKPVSPKSLSHLSGSLSFQNSHFLLAFLFALFFFASLGHDSISLSHMGNELGSLHQMLENQWTPGQLHYSYDEPWLRKIVLGDTWLLCQGRRRASDSRLIYRPSAYPT